jgi:hypothetical protein
MSKLQCPDKSGTLSHVALSLGAQSGEGEDPITILFPWGRGEKTGIHLLRSFAVSGA